MNDNREADAKAGAQVLAWFFGSIFSTVVAIFFINLTVQVAQSPDPDWFMYWLGFGIMWFFLRVLRLAFILISIAGKR